MNKWQTRDFPQVYEAIVRPTKVKLLKLTDTSNIIYIIYIAYILYIYKVDRSVQGF